MQSKRSYSDSTRWITALRAARVGLWFTGLILVLAYDSILLKKKRAGMSPRPALTGHDHSIQTSFSGFWLVLAMETNTWHVLTTDQHADRCMQTLTECSCAWPDRDRRSSGAAEIDVIYSMRGRSRRMISAAHLSLASYPDVGLPLPPLNGNSWRRQIIQSLHANLNSVVNIRNVEKKKTIEKEKMMFFIYSKLSTPSQVHRKPLRLSPAQPNISSVTTWTAEHFFVNHAGSANLFSFRLWTCFDPTVR